MPIKTILVPDDGSQAAQPALEAAFMVGRDLAAHVGVLHIGADPKDAVTLLGEGMSGAIVDEMIGLAERDIADRAVKSRAAYAKLASQYAVGGAAVAADFSEVTGPGDEVTALKGRLCDLIVAARPTSGAQAFQGMVLNAALFETGRPVLVAPPVLAETIGRKVAISWNGSAESARAVGCAMDFIAQAQELTILTAESPRTPMAVGPELTAYLSRHGVTAETRAFSPGDRPVGEGLLKECADLAADLLVMGAYTHSRMRQLILGGVTRHVLEHAEVPLFMAH